MFTFSNKKLVIAGVIIAAGVLLGATFLVYQKKHTAPSVVRETRAVLGTVEKVFGQEITLKDVKQAIGTVSSGADQEAHMVVVVEQSTVIERLSYKDGATITKESDAAHKSAQKTQAQNSSPIPPAPPEPFTREKITLSDVKPGDSVSVTATEDILTMNQFTATEIVVMVVPD